MHIYIYTYMCIYIYTYEYVHIYTYMIKLCLLFWLTLHKQMRFKDLVCICTLCWCAGTCWLSATPNRFSTFVNKPELAKLPAVRTIMTHEEKLYTYMTVAITKIQS